MLSPTKPRGRVRHAKERKMTPKAKKTSLLLATAAVALVAAGHDASAQQCPTMRKINIGVSVAPPNVVHTSPYVAKALGYFAKRCIDANIVQFEGGAAGTSVTAVGQGSAISNLPDRPIAQGLKARQVWGPGQGPPP